ncbi:MAG: patatin-like phospholipase family protein, partial [Hypericibacter sp.]
MRGTIASEVAATQAQTADSHAFHAHGRAHHHDDQKAIRQIMQAGKLVNLALQGGGAHGAFTWGVIDRLLEDERIGFDGISATSAGAMNAVVLAYGLS